MGSPANEQERGGDEGPETIVTLSKGFFMGAHEVTQAEYGAVVGDYPSRFTGDLNRPVEYVVWPEAVTYCVKLTEQERAAGRLPTGWVYRLPTEVEWEYAARAGKTNRFSFGDDPSCSLLGEYAWFYNNSGNTTHAVAGKRPNRLGLYDMNGNVWEWCSHWYGPYAGGTATDPQGAASGSNRVIRGGSWDNNANNCRSAQRNNNDPGNRNNNIGFRAVLAPAQPDPKW
jgi:formylglycine-generating enzyme required for sulfatase activity